ncbi:unnamed protein product [Spirodela intermedia]|uniref:DUF7356 domain-containing protein n=1 Tax=Spirodela intermedia TaxID=51605 RepID=A0A7I8JTZ3_SPIIN|nr:unnamed protein product [Spirodela intermedia]CAA6672922.1 unnamed protein product [Spirodela intermedia]
MTGDRLVVLVLAVLLCAPLAGCVGDAERGDPRASPAPDKVAKIKAAVNEPVKVADGVKGENVAPADRRPEGQGNGVLREDKGISAGDSSSKTAVAKEKSPVEDCGEKNGCTDTKNNFVACLKVPGNDSSGLTLLIVNKGIGSLTVTFRPLSMSVWRSPSSSENERKTNISQDPPPSRLPIRRAGEGLGEERRWRRVDNLELRRWPLRAQLPELIPNSVKDGSGGASVPSSGRLLSPAGLVYLALAAVALAVVAWLLVKHRRRAALPVSGGEHGAAAGWNDGWEESWDDDDDDEETPGPPPSPCPPPP